ncbi:hypothetical protein E2C01_097532 [Portunus trituberculatus]|uniref:Uncharacterized protein n=1 Tax=Portunus trituberculatus TaxID=210409 RepID=A0A5B7KA67_PORTR|nr:hypothetical protein [Portunus trituberculatus]
MEFSVVTGIYQVQIGCMADKRSCETCQSGEGVLATCKRPFKHCSWSPSR